MITHRGGRIFVIIWEIYFTCEIHATAKRERLLVLLQRERNAAEIRELALTTALKQ
jgi:hypothetical protein